MSGPYCSDVGGEWSIGKFVCEKDHITKDPGLVEGWVATKYHIYSEDGFMPVGVAINKYSKDD